jgi:hypothetical protein
MERGFFADNTNAPNPLLVDGFVVIPDRGLVWCFFADALFGSSARRARGGSDSMMTTDAAEGGRGRGHRRERVILGRHGSSPGRWV